MNNEEKYIHSLKYSDISRALSRDFFKVFCVNTSTDFFVEFIPHENDEALDVNRKGESFKEIVNYLVESAFSLDMDIVRAAITKNNILKVLTDGDAFTLNYRMMLENKAVYVRVKATWINNNDFTHILFAISNTDAHMQRLAMYERDAEKNLTYAAVSEALAADYDCIYYVDSKSGEFTEFKSSEDYKELNLDQSGSDFFNYFRTDFLSFIFEDDRDIFLKAFEKENLLKVLSVDRVFILTFRMLIKNRPTYIRIKVTKMLGDDNNHLVIGATNVDGSMKRKMQYEKMKEIANMDSLTGVKNKHAYVVAENIIDREIEQGNSDPFAVVVCDVNGLKIVNDTLGHKAGDQYINDACSLICEAFKRSPVYRIGGDEFAVLLKGADLKNKEKLIDEINQRVEENQKRGKVVVSIGVSDYVKGEDKKVSAVFERADALMYERKAQLKGKPGNRT